MTMWRCLVCWLWWLSCLPAWGQGSYWQLQVQGAIGPGVALYVSEELAAAARAEPRPELVLLLLDTPGGLSESMRSINQAILASPVPVVTYVAPQGARAASAGTYILYASHVAAMAPATHLGAATPVMIGPPGSPPPADTPAKTPSQADTLAHKQLNDALAYIHSLAQLRGRNAQWAERAVRDAATLTAEQALAEGVIDLIAQDVPDLLRQLDGRTVLLAEGARRLASQELAPRLRHPDWRMQFLTAISDPNIAYLLLLIGLYGLLLEFYTPGTGIPGVLGGISLLLGLYALQLLPLNYTGLALLLLGLVLLVVEALLPSFGLVGVGGLLAFVLGSVLLFDSADAVYRVAWPLIAACAASAVLLMLVVLRMVWRQRRGGLVSGTDGMLGQPARVLGTWQDEGRVQWGGESWQARCAVPLRAGQRVRILAVEGLRLTVAPWPEAEPPSHHSSDEERR